MKDHAKENQEEQTHKRKKRPVETGEEATDQDADQTRNPADLSQEGLTGLQQAYGNRAVGKLIAQRKDADVQRSPDNSVVLNDSNDQVVQRSPDNPNEFIPEMSVKPDVQMPFVGSTFKETMKVINWHEAPRGTKFQWGGSILDSEHLRFDDVSDTTKTGTAKLEATALKSGESGVTASLQYQVPGGPEMVISGPDIPVNIPQPEMWVTETKIPKNPAGDPHDLTRLSKDDRVNIRFVIKNYDPKNNLATVFRDSIDQPNKVTVDPPVFVNANTWETSIVAGNQVGPFSIKFGWNIANVDEEPPIEDNFVSSVEMDRQLFVNKCTEANLHTGRIYDSLQGWTKLLAIQYGNSWKGFKDALDAANAKEKLLDEIILNAALAFIPGGIGGVIGGMMDKLGKDAAANFLKDGVKDLVKDTLRRYPKEALPISSDQAYKALPTDPLQWQNTEEARVLKEKADVEGLVEAWIHEANTNPEFITDFDPAAEITEKLSVVGEGDPAGWAPPTEHDGFLFEKGWWHEWITTYGLYIKENTHPCTGITSRKVDDRLGKDIRDRVKLVASKLGENGEAWMDEWTGGLRAQLEEEIRRRKAADQGY